MTSPVSVVSPAIAMPDTVAMQNAAPTASATAIDKETLDQVQEISRQRALAKAAEEELPVREVGALQRQEFYALLTGQAAGSDGASTNGEIGRAEETIPEDVRAEVDERIGEEDEERKEATEAAPDALVMQREDEVAADQSDETRVIRIGHDAYASRDLKDAKRRAEHEAKHRRQEKGDQAAVLPETGDPAIDSERGILRRRVFRENDSIKAEGGLRDHTPEYHGFVRTADAVASYIDASGQDGRAMVEKAGASAEGFRKMHETILIATIRRNLKEQVQGQEALAARATS